MSTVLSSPRSVNSPIISAAAWAALGYVAGKEGDRDSLADGSAHQVDLSVIGQIDGQPVEQHIAGRLTVGHSSSKAASATPDLPAVVGSILAKLNEATRQAILRDLPAEFAANGSSLPAVPSGIVKQAGDMLARLRQSKQTTSRGAVRCEYALTGEPAALSIVG